MTLVAIGSVAIGTAALIITFTVLDGFERDLRSNIIGFASHIQVTTFRNQLVLESAETQAKLEQEKNIVSALPFLQRESIAITRDNIDGVIVKGVLPGTDISHVKAKLIEGSFSLNEIDGKSSLVIGKRFAQKLGLKVNDKIVLLGVKDIQNAMNAPKIQFVIRGMYETGMAEYFDDVYVFTSLPTAQRLFAVPAQVNGYDVLCRDTEDIDATVNQIQKVLGYPYDPRSVFSLYRNLFIWIDLQQELIPVVVGSLIIISAFNIIATLLLFVIEKTQEIGVLLALGASRRRIRRIFITQGLIIGIVGSAFGNLFAFLFSFSQQELQFFQLPEDVYYMSSVPIHMSPHVFLLTSALAIALTFLSSFIPAWLGSRLNPIQSIRFH